MDFGRTVAKSGSKLWDELDYANPMYTDQVISEMRGAEEESQPALSGGRNGRRGGWEIG